MIEIRELIGATDRVLCAVDSLDDALDRLDAECRHRSAQLAAGGEGGSRIRYTFELRHHDGRPLGALTTSPETSRGYLALIFADLKSSG